MVNSPDILPSSPLVRILFNLYILLFRGVLTAALLDPQEKAEYETGLLRPCSAQRLLGAQDLRSHPGGLGKIPDGTRRDYGMTVLTTQYCCILCCAIFYSTLHYPLLFSLYSTLLYSACCTVLYCTVLYCTVLYCTVLYGTVRYGTVRYGTVRYGTVQYSTVQYSTVLYYYKYKC